MRVSTHVPPRGIVEKQRLGGRERREIRAREGSRDISWIHCDAFHVELFVLRVGVQFSGGYDTRKSGRPSPSPLPFSSARESARVPRSSCAASRRLCGIVDDHRGGRPKSGRFLAIRDTLMAEDVLQTYHVLDEYLFPFLSFSSSAPDQRIARHVLTFPSILLKTTKTTPVTGFFLLLFLLLLAFLFFSFSFARCVWRQRVSPLIARASMNRENVRTGRKRRRRRKPVR